MGDEQQITELIDFGNLPYAVLIVVALQLAFSSIG